MTPERIKYNLGCRVRLTLPSDHIDSEYILNAGIIRKREGKYFYQAELKDPNANSVIIADLKDVNEIKNK